ncbi:MAG: ferredoxin--NADP reductase, partial [Gemmataceae bacterium]|nr:ferredoxin--NADP reductase [Gemmataceae bacterium]
MTADELDDLRRRRYNATVASLTLVNSDLMVMRVRPDFQRPAHKPGQYCTLGLGNWERRTEGCQAETLSPEDEVKVVRRAYSISCPMLTQSGELLNIAETDWLEFYIVLVRENADGRVPALTPRLFTRRAGDRIQVGERITGHYTL